MTTNIETINGIFSFKDGEDATYDFSYPSNKKDSPLVIFVHGFKGFKDWGTFNLIAKQFAKNGLAFLKFNFSHNGTAIHSPTEFTKLDKFARNTLSRELSELNQIIDYACADKLMSNFFNPEQIFCLGHSRGGAIALCAAKQNPKIAKLTTWAAPSSFNKSWTEDRVERWKKEGKIDVINGRTQQLMPLNFSLYQDYQENIEHLDILKISKFIKTPTYLLHGTEDSAVSYNDALELKQANINFKLELIPGANHTFSGHHPYKEFTLPEHLNLAVNKTINFFKN